MSQRHFGRTAMWRRSALGGITLTDKKFTRQQDEGTAFGLYDSNLRR